MSGEIGAKAAQRRAELEQGKYWPGVSPDIDPTVPPVWYEPHIFQHAQRLAKVYLAIIGNSHLMGLLLILYFPDGLAPLIATGNSETVSKLFSRYLSTIAHVNKWFKYDPFDPNSAAHRSLKIVRGMHRQVGIKMNNLAERKQDGKTNLWVNQYSMARTQFAFMGLMSIFPKEMGFHNFTSADFHSMFHFWRVIGYCIGIEDRFNLCQGSDEEIFEICRQMFYEEWVPVLKQHDKGTGVEMGKGIVLALKELFPVEFNAHMRFFAPIFQLDPHNFPLRTLKEKYAYYRSHAMSRVLARWRWFNWCITQLANRRLKRALRNKDIYQRRLKNKFPELNYNDSNICPFRLNFDYVDTLNSKKSN